MCDIRYIKFKDWNSNKAFFPPLVKRGSFTLAAAMNRDAKSEYREALLKVNI